MVVVDEKLEEGEAVGSLLEGLCACVDATSTASSDSAPPVVVVVVVESCS